MNAYLLFIIAYSLSLILLGLLIARRIKGADDFLVAGRSLGPGLIFATILAANIGAGSTVGASGLGYSFGLSAWWWVGSAGIGSLILANTVGPRIWALAKSYGFHTVGDFLERRYSPAVRCVIAGIIWTITLIILAGQLIALAWILNVVAGLPKWQGCLVGGVVVTIYFASGGLLASAWINLIELAVLLFGFVLALPMALDSSGGWGSIAREISERSGHASEQARFFSVTGIGLKGILSYLVILVPSFIVSPGLLQKIYGARDQTAVRWGVGLNALCLLLFAFLPPLLGMIAYASFPELPNPELALPMLITNLLPFWLGCLLLAAIFSAEISTCDAILFMLSSSLSKDLYKAFLNPGASEVELLRISRIAALVSGFLGSLLAILLPSVIAALTIFYGLLTVSLFVPLLAGLYWRRPKAGSAMAAIAASIAVTTAVHILTSGRGYGPLSPYAIGILVSLLAMVLV